MQTFDNRKISFWCINHDKPIEMIIQQGVSQFYACPKYFPEERKENEKMCVNRMTIIDAGGIIQKFASICDSVDPFEESVNYYNYSFIYKGTRSKIKVRIIKYTDDEIRFGIQNLTALK